MSSVQQWAEKANKFLTRDAAKDIVVPTDDAPAWFTELCRTAHGDMLPDDWRYEFIQDALNILEEEGREDDEPDLDSVYPYTADRLKWLASNLNRPGYCDEAVDEMGEAMKEIATFIALGMDREMREVFDLVKAGLEKLAEEEEAEADPD